MTLDDLLSKYPDLSDYMKYMPEELKTRCWIRVYPKGTSGSIKIVQSKDAMQT